MSDQQMMARIEDEAKRQIRMRYGGEVLGMATRRLAIHENLPVILRAKHDGYISVGGEADLQDYALDYVEAVADALESIATELAAMEDANETHPAPNRGSLQNVAAYANLVPLIVLARQDAIGSQQPMRPSDAVSWLRAEAQQGDPVTWVEIRGRFKVSEGVGRELEDANNNTVGASLAATVKELIRSELPPAAIGSRAALRRTVHTKFDRPFFKVSKEETIFLNRGKLVTLAEHAAWLTDSCHGFDRAVWLILTGEWRRLGLAINTHFRGSPGPGPIHFSDPFITIRIGELETTPDEVKRAYARTRKEEGYGTQGQALSRNTEILACLALEVKATDGRAMGDYGFNTLVLRCWRERAASFGLDRNAFKDSDHVGRILAGVEAAYRKVAEHSLVKMHDPGTLFRQPESTGAELLDQLKSGPLSKRDWEKLQTKLQRG
jgi:hypothetical protein